MNPSEWSPPPRLGLTSRIRILDQPYSETKLDDRYNAQWQALADHLIDVPKTDRFKHINTWMLMCEQFPELDLSQISCRVSSTHKKKPVAPVDSRQADSFTKDMFNFDAASKEYEESPLRQREHQTPSPQKILLSSSPLSTLDSSDLSPGSLFGEGNNKVAEKYAGVHGEEKESHRCGVEEMREDLMDVD